MATYPAHLETDVVLRDGSTIHIRPIRNEDERPLVDFMTGLSERSRWLRFFSGWSDFGRFAEQAVDADYERRLDLVATAGIPPRIVGHGLYVTTEPGRAEVAFAVADAMHGQGVATIMLGQLAEAARQNGIHTFHAVTLPENHQMLGVFRESGFPNTIRADPDEITVEFPTSLGADALERFDRREQVASAAALRLLLAPRSVAVIGASRRPETIAGAVFHNLVASGFDGPVYPVNPKADVVQAVKAYPSVTDVPGEVDLAVVVVPALAVADVARECATKGVRGLVVISSGFAEVGGEGTERQRELMGICREAGMRVVGPNCLGIMNTAPDVSLNATFAPAMPPRGRVGFLSQSGALGLAVIDRALSLGLGVSSFVSNGNKADISGNDLLGYWESDEDTDLILLYLESFGNPRKFARIARRVGKTKPIVAVKSGRSAAGARATSSHTGALLATSDVTVEALFRQSGVVRCDTLSELFDVAALLGHQPPPEGRRVAIVTNAGGPGILCADACEAEGLEVVALSDEVRSELAGFLPAEAAVQNPVDMIASAPADAYRRTITTIARSAGVDAVVAIFIPPLVTRSEDVAAALRRAAGELPRPIPLLTVFMSREGVPAELGGRIPSYAFPEEAARALGRSARYGEWRKRPAGHVPVSEDVRRDEAASIIATALGSGPGWLGPEEVEALLGCYGVPLAAQRVAATPEAAGRAAEELGGAVALKGVGPELVHKTEAGAVRLALEGRERVAAAAEDMRRSLEGAGGRIERFLVQRMVPPGIEMLVGVVHDELFGPVVAVGAGGTTAELLKDVTVRLTPLTDTDAVEMVCSLQSYPLLEGYRGAPGGDIDALVDLVLRVGAMVEAHDEVAEMDCNPVIVTPDGATVADARIRVAVAKAPLPVGARRRY